MKFRMHPAIAICLAVALTFACIMLLGDLLLTVTSGWLLSRLIDAFAQLVTFFLCAVLALACLYSAADSLKAKPRRS